VIVQQIFTHTQDALARLLAQYVGMPRVQSLITTFSAQIQDLENAIYPLDEGRAFWNGTTTPAIGAQLDIIGSLVGINRNGLSDQQYILFIFGKIAQNYSDGTRPTMAVVVQNLFQAQISLIQDYYPAGLGVEAIGSEIPPSLYPIAKAIVEGALGAGIKLTYAAASQDTNVFRFYTSGIDGAVSGFSDIYNPTIGGKYIGLI